MRRLIKLWLLALCCGCGWWSLSGCRPQVAEEQGRALAYARNILVTDGDGYRVVRMRNPWREGEWLHTYVLVDRKDSARMASETLPEGTVVYVPLRRSVVFNTAEASLLGMLDSAAWNQMAGVADLKYMHLDEVHRRVDDGRVADCGNSISPDVERIVELGADAILLSPFENSGGYGQLEEIGIPIIECAEYMETSALGRAEWMKFYGMLYGREAQAEALFAEVDSTYKALSMLGKERGDTAQAPMMLVEKLTGSTWYVAGGRSSVGQLISDAGGRYAWASDTHSGSLSLTLETVIEEAGDADVWVFNDVSSVAPTYSRLAAENPGYRLFKAYERRNVWYVNSLQVPYFEEVSFRPDWLLRDYIRLLHPGRVEGEPRYYRRLAE